MGMLNFLWARFQTDFDRLHKFMERGFFDVGARLASINQVLMHLEGKVSNIATRADFDNLKAELKQDIQTIVQSVADLKAQLAQGNPITDQDLQDLQDDINTLTGGPQPTPAPPTP